MEVKRHPFRRPDETAEEAHEQAERIKRAVKERNIKLAELGSAASAAYWKAREEDGKTCEQAMAIAQAVARG